MSPVLAGARRLVQQRAALQAPSKLAQAWLVRREPHIRSALLRLVRPASALSLQVSRAWPARAETLCAALQADPLNP
jgi:hypothetical protein